MILTVTANAAIDKRCVLANLEKGAVNRAAECTYSAGGKGLNVARTAHIAGEEVVATGFLAGHAGKYIEERIRQDGVTSDFVWCQGESRSCVNIWDEKNSQQTEILEPGFEVTGTDMDHLVEKFTGLIAEATVAAVSGSVPSGGDFSLYQRILEAGRNAGKKVILDTSGKLLEEGIKYHPFMIKPNMDEIQMLSGKKIRSRDELLDAAQVLHNQGISAVVISMGGDGSLMSCETGAYVAHVPKIDAVNTVGCGDSMIGGFCVGIERGMKMDECLKLASAISAASAMTQETGFFRMEDMQNMLGKIEIEKVR